MNGLFRHMRMRLAIEAFNKGQFKTACAAAFDAPPGSLMTRLNGTASQQKKIVSWHQL